MAEASKVNNNPQEKNLILSTHRPVADHPPTQLFDQKASEGKVSSETSKESAVMKAGEMALKFYMKGQGSGGSGGEEGGSKTSGLLSLASKFIK